MSKAWFPGISKSWFKDYELLIKDQEIGKVIFLNLMKTDNYISLFLFLFNRRLAEALNIENPDLSPEVTVRFSPFLRAEAK